MSERSAWLRANRNYVDARLQHLRLALQRRALELQCARTSAREAGPAPPEPATLKRDNAATRRVADEFSAAARRLDVLHAATIAAGGPPALDILARVFRLSAFDEIVLLLALAPEIDPAFERLYAYVQDDASRKRPTAALALTMTDQTGTSWDGAWTSLSPEAPLRRFQLISFDGVDGSAESIRTDRRIVDYTLGINRLDERAALVLKALKKPRFLPASLAAIVTSLERMLRANGRREGMPAINLIGSCGSGRRALAAALADRLELTLYELRMARAPASAGDLHDVARLLERESLLFPAALFIDAHDAEQAVRGEGGWLRELIDELRSFVILASCEHWRSDRAFTLVDVARLGAAAHLEMWRAALVDELAAGDRELDAVCQRLAQQFDFGPETVQRAADGARGAARLRDPAEPRVTARDLWTASKAQTVQAMDGLAQRIDPVFTWDDIVLPDDTLHQLHEIVAQVALGGRVYEDWGFGARLPRGRGIAVLFAGPSGTGKTMAAEIIASELAIDLFRIDLAGVVSKYIGETEKNLRKVFKAAERGGAILFFDEADALFGKRTEVSDSHDRYANIEINYLLQRMEDYRGLAILATNAKDMLDHAFLRRLRYVVDFPFPSPAERSRIWKRSFPREAPLVDLDFAALGRLDISGGNIRSVTVNAAFLAAGDGDGIRMQHVLRAARREYVKLEKLIRESDFPQYAAAVL